MGRELADETGPEGLEPSTPGFGGLQLGVH